MSDVLERFRVRVEGTLQIRPRVAEMTPDEALAAVEFLERELQLMRKRPPRRPWHCCNAQPTATSQRRSGN
jgi:hypothetical protein